MRPTYPGTCPTCLRPFDLEPNLQTLGAETVRCDRMELHRCNHPVLGPEGLEKCVRYWAHPYGRKHVGPTGWDELEKRRVGGDPA